MSNKAYWLAKVVAIEAMPHAAFDIIRWDGKRENVRATIINVYRHLAVCCKAHGPMTQRPGRPLCPDLI